MRRRGAPSRRRFLGSVAATAASLAWLPIRARGAAAAPADDWPQFRRDPRLTGVTDSPPPSLDVLWTHEAGEDGIESSAAIVGDTVYVGTVSGQLLAVDLQTGEPGAGPTRPARRSGSRPRAFATGSRTSGTSTAWCTRCGSPTGRRAWTFEAGSEIRASPVVHEDRIVIGSYDQRLYALDAKTGARRWSFETEGPVHCTAAVDSGLTYVSGCDGELRALRLEDGTQAFSVSSGGYTGASPALAGGRAYYGTFENEVLGVDLAAKSIVWRYAHAAASVPLLLLGRPRGGAWWCWAAETGWCTRSRPAPARSGGPLPPAPGSTPRRPSPGAASTSGSGDGRLYVLDLKTGERLEDFDTASAISASPAIARGRLVVGTLDGQLYCLGRRA